MEIHALFLAAVVAVSAAHTQPRPAGMPPEWEEGWTEGSLQYSTTAPRYQDQYGVLVESAPIGNGIVATVADLDAVYLGGIFNTFIELKR